MLKRILKLYRGHKKWVFLFSVLTILNGIASLLLPYGTKLMVSSLVGEGALIPIKWVFILLTITITGKAIVWYFYRLISDIIGSEIELKLRLKLYKHIHTLPNNFFKNQKSGEVTSTLINDISSLKDIAQSFPEEILWILIMFLGVMGIAFATSIKMFIVMFVIFSFNALIISLTSKNMSKVFLQVKKERGNITQHSLNSFHGITDSKSFGNESFDYNLFKTASTKYRKSWWYANKKIGMHDSINSISYYGSYLIILGVSYYYTSQGVITIPEFVMFQMYMGYLFEPIYRASAFSKTWQHAKSAMERVDNITKLKPQKDTGTNVLKTLRKEIKFNKVTLAFKDKVVLKNLSLQIKANTNIALVGKSGGGKTTMINSILRFVDDYKGKILIDGKDIKSYTIKSLRENIGLIQQDPYIFPGTLYDNVKYGRITASTEEVLDAIQKAELSELVKEHKKGVRLKVGENGVKLSGGQKQRVAIARVILKNPQIVILDEATSALDTATERKIQTALTTLMTNRTSIIIAHRLNTIMKADKIAVIGNNTVISQGTHKELMRDSEIYKDLQGI